MYFFVFSFRLPNLFEASRFSFQLSDESDILSSNLEGSEDFDFCNSRRIDWENLLDSYTVDIFTDGDGFVKGCFSVGLDDETLEFLDTFLGSFLDNLMYFHFHTGSDFWSFILDGILLDGLNKCCVHNSYVITK